MIDDLSFAHDWNYVYNSATEQWVEYDTIVKAYNNISTDYSNVVNNLLSRTDIIVTQQQYDALFIFAYNRPALLKRGGVIEQLMKENAPKDIWQSRIISEYATLKGWDKYKNGWISRTTDSLELYFDGDYVRNH